MRRFIAAAARTRLAGAATSMLERLLPDDPHRLGVLTYHRVGTYTQDQPRYPGLFSATTAEFARQMEFLARHRRVLSGEELLAIARGAAEPRGGVAVTFDDAYRDFRDEALPVLRRVGVPAILFVPTAYPSSPARGFWWDRLYTAMRRVRSTVRFEVAGNVIQLEPREGIERPFRALTALIKGLPHGEAQTVLDQALEALPDPGPCHDVLDWEAIRFVAREGVTVGPHSRTHPRLDHLDDQALREEVTGSRDDLARELGAAAAPIFAYPDGGHDDRAVAAVGAAGHHISFTTERGTNDVRALDWLRVRRINVGPRSSLALIRAQLLTRSQAATAQPEAVQR